MRPAEAKLTFAIPFYRGRRFLERAIASVRRQTRPDWQLVICDDGPDTDLAEFIASLHDARISYRRNAGNLGMAGNWNRCLDVADTELVTLLHEDDELLAHYAETMVGAAARYPEAAALFCNARIIDDEGRPVLSVPDLVKRLLVLGRRDPLLLRGQDGLTALLRGNFIMCPTLCYRKSLLGPRRFSLSWRMVQDLDLYARLLLDGATIVGVSRTAYAYRRHAVNATAIYTESMLRFQEEIALYDRLAHTASERGWSRAARVARQRTIVRLHLLYRSLEDLFKRRPGAAWRKLAFLASQTGAARTASGGPTACAT